MTGSATTGFCLGFWSNAKLLFRKRRCLHAGEGGKRAVLVVTVQFADVLVGARGVARALGRVLQQVVQGAVLDQQVCTCSTACVCAATLFSEFACAHQCKSCNLDASNAPDLV